MAKAKQLIQRATVLPPTALRRAMQQATDEILADEKTCMYGGGRPDKRRAVDSYDINCGLCEEWAERVREIYHALTGTDEVQVLSPGNLDGDPEEIYGHVFIRCKGVIYDAECPEGVVNWRELPLFKKQSQVNPDGATEILSRYLDDYRPFKKGERVLYKAQFRRYEGFVEDYSPDGQSVLVRIPEFGRMWVLVDNLESRAEA